MLRGNVYILIRKCSGVKVKVGWNVTAQLKYRYSQQILKYCNEVLLLRYNTPLNINMQFLSQLFTFTDITDCFCNSCVFKINLSVFDSLSAIKQERELSLVLVCRGTSAFCAHASDVCTLKTVYKKFKLIWFKTHDFSVIDMIIKTKKMFFFIRVSLVWAVKAQPCSAKGGGEQQLICI